MSGTEQAVAFRVLLAALDIPGSDAERIDEITALEQLKAAISARQARLTDAFAVSHRAELIQAGVKPVDARRSVCAQIALARRDGPHKGNRHVGLAHTLVHEMPQVLQVLERGQGSEWRATLIARETAHLSVEDHARIDAALAPHLAGWSDRHTAQRARGWAHRLDPQGAADRARQAVTDRRVTIRPAPDCMTYLTALLPMKEGVGVYGVLHRAAMTAHTNPDDHRSTGQVMADELIRRTLTPGAGEPEPPAVELHLIMTDRALADQDSEPAHLIGQGPVPAPIARDLLTADQHTRVWVRRLFTDPTTVDLLATDARRRDFPAAARQFLVARDQICRTPVGRPSLRGRHPTLREGQADSATKEADRAVHSRRCADPRGRPRPGRQSGRVHRPAKRQRPVHRLQPGQGPGRVDHPRRRHRSHHHHHPHRTHPPRPATATTRIRAVGNQAPDPPSRRHRPAGTADRDRLAC